MGSTEDYLEAARIVVERAETGGRVVVVVSAMRNCTDKLQKALDHLNRHPPSDVAAQLLATGDLQSAALLTAAICDQGVTARLLPSHRIGVVGAGSPLRSKLVSFNAEHLHTVLRKSRVVVLPGGHATNNQGTVVMLGRNSSDLTAVCIAAAVGSRSCQIVSSVLGIHTADPSVILNPPLIKTIDYKTAFEVARSGARVLHPQAIRLACTNQIRIRCTGPPPALQPGTIVGPFEDYSHELIVVAATTSETWRIDDVRNIRTLEKSLERESIESLLVLRGHERYVVVPYGFSAATTDRICGVHGRLTNLRLLSLIRGSQEPERILVPAENLVDEARRRHASIHELTEVIDGTLCRDS
ncbi:MAG: hypothetical protein JO227_25210 [Acetobacteraceae bacterium]|nr:hypothetical protein [Acetobacteraceae bacterium]